MKTGSSISAILVLGTLLAGCGSDNPTQPVERTGFLYDVAGKAGSAGYTGNDGPAVKARLYYPQDMIVSHGNVLIVDWNNHVIRKVDSHGTITRAMGSGIHGDDSDGPVLEVNLNHPDNMAEGPSGDYYICGWHNWKIKKVDHITGIVSSVVGTDNGFGGDGGPAIACMISLPSSVVWDHAGNMYITDQGNTRIRKIDSHGIIGTFAGGAKGYVDGTGVDARFNWSTGTDSYPGGKMDINAAGTDFYLADSDNHRIRKINIATREVTTVGGTGQAAFSGDGGPATSASFNQPTDIACTPDGDVFVADSGNHAVRKISANGIVTTVAGTGVAGFSPDGTEAMAAQLDRPSGVYWDDSNRTLYIADTFNHQIKKIKFAE